VKTFEGSKVSLVVDIMEARRIGLENIDSEKESHGKNYVLIKYEVLDARGQTDPSLRVHYAGFSEGRGSRHDRWIDSFHMAPFPWEDYPRVRITMKQGHLVNHHIGDAMAAYNACTSKEIPVSLSYRGARLLLPPAWYQWKTNAASAASDAFIKITAQLVETCKMPNVSDFLPYPQWPPMVLHTKKSRLDLMLEEEEQPDDTRFQGKLGDRLISYNPATLPRILDVFAGDYNRDFMLAFGLVMGAPLIDRTGTLGVAKYDFQPVAGSTSVELTERRLNIANLYPVPALQTSMFSKQSDGPADIHSLASACLAELLMGRAAAIMRTAQEEGRKVRVLWSGGIDTTALVVAFHAIVKNDRRLQDMITICHCERSKSEYPLFYETTIRKFKTYQIPQHVRDIFIFEDKSDALLVTGDPADMMFGTYVMSQCVLDPPTLRQGGPFSPLYLHLEADWPLFAEFMVHKGLLADTARQHWLQWIEPFLAKSPIPVKTVFDFLWWCSFGLKYQHDLNRIFYNSEHQQIPAHMVTMVVNFYDTVEFAQWSYHFHESKMRAKSVWASYKHALKDFIRGHTGDQTYYGAKLKVQSVSNTWGFEHGLDTNYNLLRCPVQHCQSHCNGLNWNCPGVRYRKRADKS
jgi:hypothetical protein